MAFQEGSQTASDGFRGFLERLGVIRGSQWVLLNFRGFHLRFREAQGVPGAGLELPKSYRNTL